MAARLWLRIAVVQFAPKLGEVHANVAKARELCRGLAPRSVDLVCLPEMIFTGYMFPDASSIKPYLEHPKTGPTASFCAELARRLECHVVAGFPERLESLQFSTLTDTATSTSAVTGSSPGPSDPNPSAHPPVGANAALVYDPTGRLVHTYHKSNLFLTDVTWARPGSGFTAFDLPAPFGRTAVAICNDLNVTAGEAWASIEWGPYELAEFCEREGVRVLVLLNAWLKPKDGGMESVEEDQSGAGDEPGPGDDPNGVTGAGENEGGGDSSSDHEGMVEGDDGLEPNWRVLNYWAMRLRPLWAVSKDVDAKTGAEEWSKTSADTARVNGQREVIVVVCNRFGRERGKTFAGSSAMFSMRRGSGRPRLMHVMGEREEGVCVWTVRIGSDATVC